MRLVVKWILILVLAAFFLVAGGLKLVDPGEFLRAILRYQVFSAGLAWILALWVPWLEVVAAGALFLRAWRQAGAGLILAMLTGFEVLLTSAALRGLDIDCGCLGSGVGTSVQFALLRNLGLLLAVIMLIILERPKQ